MLTDVRPFRVAVPSRPISVRRRLQARPDMLLLMSNSPQCPRPIRVIRSRVRSLLSRVCVRLRSVWTEWLLTAVSRLLAPISRFLPISNPARMLLTRGWIIMSRSESIELTLSMQCGILPVVIAIMCIGTVAGVVSPVAVGPAVHYKISVVRMTSGIVTNVDPPRTCT